MDTLDPDSKEVILVNPFPAAIASADIPSLLVIILLAPAEIR